MYGTIIIQLYVCVCVKLGLAHRRNNNVTALENWVLLKKILKNQDGGRETPRNVIRVIK